MTMVDKPNGLDYNLVSVDDLENMMTSEVDEINELANMLASIGMEEVIDDEYEALMDALYAEHEAMMHAANSYDNDAIAYGEMV